MILYMICGSHGQLGDGASEHEATCMMALGESAFGMSIVLLGSCRFIRCSNQPHLCMSEASGLSVVLCQHVFCLWYNGSL